MIYNNVCTRECVCANVICLLWFCYIRHIDLKYHCRYATCIEIKILTYLKLYISFYLVSIIFDIEMDSRRKNNRDNIPD